MNEGIRNPKNWEDEAYERVEPVSYEIVKANYEANMRMPQIDLGICIGTLDAVLNQDNPAYALRQYFGSSLTEGQLKLLSKGATQVHENKEISSTSPKYLLQDSRHLVISPDRIQELWKAETNSSSHLLIRLIDAANAYKNKSKRGAQISASDYISQSFSDPEVAESIHNVISTAKEVLFSQELQEKWKTYRDTFRGHPHTAIDAQEKNRIIALRKQVIAEIRSVLEEAFSKKFEPDTQTLHISEALIQAIDSEGLLYTDGQDELPEESPYYEDIQ